LTEYILLSEIAPNPDNPREKIVNEALVTSIQEIGLQDPITVRRVTNEDDVPQGVKFIVVDGDCRFDALCSFLEPTEKLPVGEDIIIRPLSRDEAYDINVSLNLQRENYSLREECNIVDHYKGKELSQRDIAKKCNRSKGWVIDRLNFLAQPSVIQAQILTGDLNLNYYRTKEKVPASGQSEGFPSPEEQALDIEDRAERTTWIFKVDYPQFEDEYGNKIQIKRIEGDRYLVEADTKEICLEIMKNKSAKTIESRKVTGNYTIDQATVDYLKAELAAGSLDGEIIQEIVSGEYINVVVRWAFQEEKENFLKYLRRLAAERPKTDEEKDELTIILTREQYTALHEDAAYTTRARWISEKLVDDTAKIVVKNYDDFAATMSWLFDHVKDYPLSVEQLEKYTEYSPEEIQEIQQQTIEQLATKQQELPKLNIHESFMGITQKELDSLTPALKALITDQDTLNKDAELFRIYFSSWDDQRLFARWLGQSRDWKLNRLDFPARTFETVAFNDILIDEKYLKESFPDVFEELKNIQNFTKNIKQVSLRTLNEISLAAKRLTVFAEELTEDLKLLKSRRRTTGGSEQHLKICQKCLQPKWFDLNQSICGTCQYNGNHATNGGIAK